MIFCWKSLAFQGGQYVKNSTREIISNIFPSYLLSLCGVSFPKSQSNFLRQRRHSKKMEFLINKINLRNKLCVSINKRWYSPLSELVSWISCWTFGPNSIGYMKKWIKKLQKKCVLKKFRIKSAEKSVFRIDKIWKTSELMKNNSVVFWIEHKSHEKHWEIDEKLWTLNEKIWKKSRHCEKKIYLCWWGS